MRIPERDFLCHVLIRKGFATGEIMVSLVINGRKFPQIEKLAHALYDSGHDQLTECNQEHQRDFGR